MKVNDSSASVRLRALERVVHLFSVWRVDSTYCTLLISFCEHAVATCDHHFRPPFSQALHAKGRLRGLDVAGIVAATDDALTSSVSPEAAGIDGRPLASYIEVERASLIDSLHTSFGAPKSWIETAGGQAGARVEGDNAASAKKPKGRAKNMYLPGASIHGYAAVLVPGRRL